MLALKRLTPESFCIRASMVASQHTRQQDMLYLLPLQHYAQMTPKRFLDIYQLGKKAAIEKERARLFLKQIK
ncbi:hypothetical protein L6164_019016 [Bauhinia variegata]|uniref:Uncharacterized protein n=1 Tax=Bauhinia variegata TaxID=167791 RepID=A0ACB9NGH2_BAUVA|nr:hypothetical protein L6164_019016 [Bauhinia variegata]